MQLHVYGAGLANVNLDASASICFTRVMNMKISEDAVDAWISLVRANDRAMTEIETKLAKNDLPPLAWYDALFEIEKAGAEGVRPYALHDRLLMPQYGTSRLLNRIVKAGLIRRAASVTDRRGYVVQITDEGRAMRQKMWPVYAGCLKNIFGNGLTDDDIRMIKRLMDRVAAPSPN